MKQFMTIKDQKIKLMLFVHFLIILMFVLMLNTSFGQNSYVSYNKNSELNYTNTHLVSGIPNDFKLYENPINSSSIKFDIPAISQVKMTVFDKKGGIVKGYLYDNIQPGTYELNVSDLDNGNYTYTMSAGDYTQSY